MGACPHLDELRLYKSDGINNEGAKPLGKALDAGACMELEKHPLLYAEKASLLLTSTDYSLC